MNLIHIFFDKELRICLPWHSSLFATSSKYKVAGQSQFDIALEEAYPVLPLQTVHAGEVIHVRHFGSQSI